MTYKRRDAAPDSRNGDDGSNRAQAERAVAINAVQVAAYLRRHPDFLARNPDLLDVLEPPARPEVAAGGRGVIDLQQAMVQRLREEAEQQRHAREELIATWRSNMTAQAQVHQAILALLSARSFEHLIETITTDLAVALGLDTVCLCVERSTDSLPPTRTGGVLCVAPGTVDRVLGRNRSVLLQSDLTGEEVLFGPGAGLVRSQAALRLSISEATPPALLVLGSRDPEHFSEGQSTELLQFLAQALEHLVRAWLELPE